MDESSLLFRGNPEAAKALADRLDLRRIEYVIEDHYQAEGRHRSVGISHTDVHVAAADEPAAVAARTEWLSSSEAHAAGLSRRIVTLACLSTIPAIAWLALSFAGTASIPEPDFEGFAVLTGVSFVVLAQLEHRRRTSERIELPH